MSRKHTPTPTEVSTNLLEELGAMLDKVTEITGNAPALTATDIRRATKLHKGGQIVITTIASLAKQFGLTIASYPTDTMVAKVNLATSLVPLHRKLVEATKQVGDSMFLAQSESWQSASVYYSTLRRMAKTDGNIATTLAPVTQYFARPAPAAAPSNGGPVVATATAATPTAATPAQTAAPSPAPVNAAHS